MDFAPRHENVEKYTAFRNGVGQVTVVVVDSQKQPLWMARLFLARHLRTPCLPRDFMPAAVQQHSPVHNTCSRICCQKFSSFYETGRKSGWECQTVSSTHFLSCVSIKYNTTMRITQRPSELSLEAVRRLARTLKYEESYFNEISKVISFIKLKETLHRVRINVYYTTGTVGTCIYHPRLGRRQLFRRNVDMQQLREIFRNPRVHTGKGYHRLPSLLPDNSQSTKSVGVFSQKSFPIGSLVNVKGLKKCTVVGAEISYYGGETLIEVEYEDGVRDFVRPDDLEEVQEEVQEETSAIKSQIEILLADKRFIDQQLGELQAALEDIVKERRRKEEERRREKDRFEKERRQKEEQERREKERLEKERQAKILEAKREAKRIERGNKIDYYIQDPDFVGKHFSDRVTALSCAGGATIMLYETADWVWSPGIPKLLHNKLNGRQRTLPKPTYVAIGSMGRYYIEFADGVSEFYACEEMNELLVSPTTRIASVAFGERWGSYAIVYADGGYQYSDIPDELDDIIRVRRKKRGDLKYISLGPTGEYFLSTKNGKSWWGGISTTSIKEINKFSDRIQFLDFSDHDSYVLRYS